MRSSNAGLGLCSILVLALLGCAPGGSSDGGQDPGTNSSGGAEPSSPPQAAGPPPPLTEKEKEIAGQIFQKKCKLCHYQDEREHKIMKGPGFLYTRKTLPDRLARYDQIVPLIEKRDAAHYAANKASYDAILAETDPQRRMLLWLVTYQKNPKFENKANKMLKQPLSDGEIDIISRHIMELEL